MWTPAPLRAFLKLTSDHHHGKLIRLAAMTGMRRAELCGLRWSDVNLDAASLTLRQTITAVNSRPVVGDVKTPTSRRVIDLATVIDLDSRRVVGWALADHMRTELVEDALELAFVTRRPPEGLIFHSDRGGQHEQRLRRSGPGPRRRALGRPQGECCDCDDAHALLGPA